MIEIASNIYDFQVSTHRFHSTGGEFERTDHIRVIQSQP